MNENERICCRNSNCDRELEVQRTRVRRTTREPARSFSHPSYYRYNVRKKLGVAARLGQRCITYDIKECFPSQNYMYAYML